MQDDKTAPWTHDSFSGVRSLLSLDVEAGLGPNAAGIHLFMLEWQADAAGTEAGRALLWLRVPGCMLCAVAG